MVIESRPLVHTIATSHAMQQVVVVVEGGTNMLAEKWRLYKKQKFGGSEEEVQLRTRE